MQPKGTCFRGPCRQDPTAMNIDPNKVLVIFRPLFLYSIGQAQARSFGRMYSRATASVSSFSSTNPRTAQRRPKPYTANPRTAQGRQLHVDPVASEAAKPARARTWRKAWVLSPPCNRLHRGSIYLSNYIYIGIYIKKIILCTISDCYRVGAVPDTAPTGLSKGTLLEDSC